MTLMPEKILYYTIIEKDVTKKGKQKLKLKCNHCGHIFDARVEDPKKCPRCQKDLWNWRTAQETEKIAEDSAKLHSSVSITDPEKSL